MKFDFRFVAENLHQLAVETPGLEGEFHIGKVCWWDVTFGRRISRFTGFCPSQVLQDVNNINNIKGKCKHVPNVSVCFACVWSELFQTVQDLGWYYIYISHRIHVWYIYLHLPNQMWVNIPYMDSMGNDSGGYGIFFWRRGTSSSTDGGFTS